MTEPLSWMRKLHPHDRQQCWSDLKHHDKFVAEKVREEVLRRFEAMVVQEQETADTGPFGEANQQVVDVRAVTAFIAEIRAEPVKVGPR